MKSMIALQEWSGDNEEILDSLEQTALLLLKIFLSELVAFWKLLHDAGDFE